MLEISELKAMSLADLKQLAKALAIPKHTALNKVDLIYKIMEFKAQAEEQVKEEKGVIKEVVKEEVKGKKGPSKKAKDHILPEIFVEPDAPEIIESEEERMENMVEEAPRLIKQKRKRIGKEDAPSPFETPQAEKIETTEEAKVNFTPLIN